MLVESGQGGQDSSENNPGGQQTTVDKCWLIDANRPVIKRTGSISLEQSRGDSPEATEHAGYHHIQDDKLAHHVLLG